MKVLMITGDKTFAASPRFALQAAQVEKLEVVHWGRGSMWPKLPQGQFDVITAQDPFWRGLFAWWVARRTGARLNIQMHASVLNMLGKFILRRADSVRVVSEKIKKQVEGIGVRAPVQVLPIYIDISKFRNIARHSCESDSQRKTILWVGRFEDEKNPTLAISILQAVLRSGVDVRLIMLGEGSLTSKLKARAHAASLPVEFPGWRDPAAYLAQADAVLCTSKHESWGASMIEALAAGVPVVAPDVGVAREAGAVVVPKEKLAEAVEEVLQSGQHGELTLQLPNAQEWARQWKESLV